MFLNECKINIFRLMNLKKKSKFYYFYQRGKYDSEVEHPVKHFKQ